jgi:hypothetical protein
VLEMDFAIDRTGRVDPIHAARYTELGDWIRSCYGTPVGEIAGKGGSFLIQLPGSGKYLESHSIHRFFLHEVLQT